MLLNVSGNGIWSFPVRGAADAVESGLICKHLDDNQVVGTRLREDYLHVCDFERRHATSGDGLSGGERARGAEHAGG
jgi:hypothetical protein